MTSFGRVISVRGSLARVGLLAVTHSGLSEVRATVGRFVSIRCANSTIVAMITDVTCEDLPKRKPRRNVTDFRHPEPARFNRFSSHRRHSDGLKEIHNLPGNPQ